MSLKSYLSRWWQRLFAMPTPALPIPDQSPASKAEDRAPRAATRRRRKLRHLPIRVRQQAFDYSCVAACLQMLFEFFNGKPMSHRRAVRLTRCKPNGAELAAISRTLKKLCGTESRNLRTPVAARCALHLGIPVVASDPQTYEDDHAILLIGCSAKGFYVVDPNTGEINWRRDAWVGHSDEFIAILRKDDERWDTLAKAIAKKRRRARTHYYAPPIRFAVEERDRPPRLPVATIRLVPQSR